MTYEYTTPELVKAELRAEEDFASFTNPTLGTIEEWIKEVSEEINHIAGRAYGETEYTEVFDYRGDDVILLKNAPVIEVESVKYSPHPLGSEDYGFTETKTENTHFALYKESGEIELLSGWNPASGLKRIEIVYKAGFEEVPKIVQMLATKKATKRVIDSLLSKDINQKQSGKSVSVGSIRIVKPANFGVNQYQLLKTEIQELEQELINGTTLYRLPMNRY